MFGSYNYSTPVTTGKRVSGFTTRKQPQFKLGWNVTDQTNQYQIRNSKNKKQITGKITQDKSLPKNTAHYNYDYKPYNNNINKNDNTSLLRNDDIYKQFNNKSKYEEEPEEIRRKNESEYLRQQYEKLQGEQKAYYQNQMKNPYEENNQYNDFNSLPINHQNLNEKNQQNRQYINQNNYEQIPQPNEYQNARNDIENLPMSHSNDHNYQNSPYDYSHNQYVKQLQLQEYENYKRALERQDKALKNQQQKFENKKPSEKNINPYSHQQGYQIQQPTHQHQPNSFNRNSENNSYQNQQEELQKIMASYDQKKGMINEKKFTPSENSKYQKRVSSNSFNSGTGTQIKAERRTLLKPKQSIRDVIFNGMGVGEPIIPQRNAAKRVNSNMILGGDNYAFASHK